MNGLNEVRTIRVIGNRRYEEPNRAKIEELRIPIVGV